MHSTSRVLLGATGSNIKEVSVYSSDPASTLAGKRVVLGSNGALSHLKSAGFNVGISLGASLSDTKKTAVCRLGEKVPVRCHLKRARGVITITNYANLINAGDDTITVGETTFVAQSGAATPTEATFRAATSNDATATSLAAQINAHAETSLLVKAVAAAAVVTVYALTPGVAGNEIALAYSDEGTATVGATVSGEALASGSATISDIDYIVKGQNAYINDIDGMFDIAAFGTISDAIYIGGPITGIAEDGSEVAATIIDMLGGL